MNWKRVCSPMEHGGLGILDIEKFSRALRVRWLWHAWRHPDRPWVGTKPPCDAKDRALFNAATSVSIGNGNTALFWHSCWIGPTPLKVCFPELFKHSRRKNRSVAQALRDDTWISDLAHGDTTNRVRAVIDLHRLLLNNPVALQEDAEDQIRWDFESSGEYCARSAYRMQFLGSKKEEFKEHIWDAWAPAKLKIFAWLLHQDRLWCNDRLQRRGWPNNYFCQLCLRNLESSDHLFFRCNLSISVWNRLAAWHGCGALRHDQFFFF